MKLFLCFINGIIQGVLFLCLTSFAQPLSMGVTHVYTYSCSSFIFIAARLNYSQAVFPLIFKTVENVFYLYPLKSLVFIDMCALLA